MEIVLALAIGVLTGSGVWLRAQDAHIARYQRSRASTKP